MNYDVVALGELLIDFASRSVSKIGYPTMEALPGGAPANFLAALTKFGVSTALLGKVGNDTFGKLLTTTLGNAGIETRGLVMADDVFVLIQDGYEAGRETEDIYEISEDKKTKKEKKKYKGWEGKLLPKALIESAFFAAERAKIDKAQAICDETQGKLDELVEEQTADGGVLADYLNDKDAVDTKAVNAKIKELKKAEPNSEELAILYAYTDLSAKIKEYAKIVKELNVALDEECKAKYAELTIDEIKELLVNRKWYYTIFEGIKALYVTTSHKIAGRVSELAERYEDTLPSLESDVESYEAKVKAHLERMGFVW